MKYSIGIDLGGTKIEGVLMNEKGKIIERCRRATEANKSKNHILSNIVEVIGIVKTKKVVGVGIGHPGSKELVNQYVLEKFTPEEKKIINKIIEYSIETIDLLLNDKQLFLTKVNSLLHKTI